MKELFLTGREKVLKAYQKAQEPFIANTHPYHSTRSIRFDVVNGANGAAYAVCRPQELHFFDYGMGDQIELGATAERANETDTNLGKAHSTNGAADFVIEGISFGSRGARVASGYAGEVGFDAAVVAALAGNAPMFDPAGLVIPPQIHSPFNLENALLSAVIGHGSLEFEWDQGNKVRKMGVIDLLPQGGGSSYLRSNGAPVSGNRFAIPEGHLWRRDGQGDSEFMARVRITRSIVVPLTLVTAPGEEAASVPTAIWLECIMRLYGLHVTLPSQN